MRSRCEDVAMQRSIFRCRDARRRGGTVVRLDLADTEVHHALDKPKKRRRVISSAASNLTLARQHTVHPCSSPAATRVSRSTPTHG